LTPFFNKSVALKCAICTAILVSLLTINRSPNLSHSDRSYIDSFFKEFKLENNPVSIHKSFDSELDFISKLQDVAILHIEQTEVPHKYFGDIEYYFKQRKGFCYDRAIFMEKIFKLFKFDFRHIYIYFPSMNQKETAISNFFKKGTKSHALLEVKTKKGWMLIETNCNWLGLKSNKELLTVESFNELKINQNTIDFYKNPSCGIPFWKRYNSFRYIYGFYSRHGDFFSRSSIIPDINLKMLLSNFF
jgi:hypothetical protein